MMYVAQVGANGSVLSASVSLHSRAEQVGTENLDTHSSSAIFTGGNLHREYIVNIQQIEKLYYSNTQSLTVLSSNGRAELC